MSAGLIAFLITLGAVTYLYNYFMRTTGGNTKTALTMSGGIGAVLFILLLFIINLIPK